MSEPNSFYLLDGRSESNIELTLVLYQINGICLIFRLVGAVS